jgi:hypothetical protein
MMVGFDLWCWVVRVVEDSTGAVESEEIDHDIAESKKGLS